MTGATPSGLLGAIALSSGYVAGAWSIAVATLVFLCLATPLLTFLKVRGLAALWTCILAAAVAGAITACLDPLFAHWREASGTVVSDLPLGAQVIDRPPEGPNDGFGIIMLALLYSVAGAVFWFVTRHRRARQEGERRSGAFPGIGVGVVYWIVLLVVLAALVSELTRT